MAGKLEGEVALATGASAGMGKAPRCVCVCACPPVYDIYHQSKSTKASIIKTHTHHRYRLRRRDWLTKVGIVVRF